MVDYLIVGFGLGGMCFSHVAVANGKTILVIDDNNTNSSRVAAGLINPVILKRFTTVWKAEEQIDFLQQFYKEIEARYSKQYLFELPILRKLASVEEQNNWFSNADKVSLSRFLNTELNRTNYDFISSPFYFGEVSETGYLNIASLIDDTIEELKNTGAYINESFDYNCLNVSKEYVEYNGSKAKRIVFAEGYAMRFNPLFNTLPLDGTKGEVITIKAPNLKLDKIVKAGVFVMPVGDTFFRVGATYNWKDKDNRPTSDGLNELIEKFKAIVSVDFEVVEHKAEVRPTVRDRRPLVGQHDEFSNVYLLNGLGTRGVMLGPYLSQNLFDFIEKSMPLPVEIDIKRFF